jgi:tRNA threonylcarbamoyladenosine biosynthesis protein TsaB
MSYILHLETAMSVCSVAIAEDGEIITVKDTNIANSHSSLITSLVEEALQVAKLGINDMNAICVSMGPGSYTGLRIGISTAKGFCYALGIPLIAVNSLLSMANHYANEYAKELTNETLLCPMIDARRMEVYTALFDEQLQFVKETSADIINENSFKEILSEKKVIFFGDGAAKCREYLSQNKNALLDDTFSPSSKGMVSVAWQKFQNKQFEDVAYFEPYYLKDFIATIPRKLF